MFKVILGIFIFLLLSVGLSLAQTLSVSVKPTAKAVNFTIPPVTDCSPYPRNFGYKTVYVSCATPKPTASPTMQPTSSPSPTASPTMKPTVAPTAAPTVTPSPTYPLILSGTVTDLNNPNGFDSCPPAGTVYFNGFGCVPVQTTGAQLIGSMVIGASFQAFGPAVVTPPNVITTKVIFTAPSPTPVPTVAGNVPTVANGGLVNGQEYSVNFAPYGVTAAFNQKVPANPTITSYSASVIASQFSTSIGGIRGQEAGPYDYSYETIYATTSDPKINLVCSVAGDCNTDNGGTPTTMYMPAKARFPACESNNCTGYYSDAVLAVIQPNGDEYDMAYGTPNIGRDWQNGDTLKTDPIANCGSWYTGSGFLVGGGSTAGKNCTGGGIIRPIELETGVINHAIKMLNTCQGAVNQQAGQSQGMDPVYPAPPGAYTLTCSGGVGAPMGAWMWYDVPASVTQARTDLQPWEKAILVAMNVYGGYFLDNGCPSGDNYPSCTKMDGGLGGMVESGQAQYDFGYDTPYSVLASQGWYGGTVSGAYAPRNGKNNQRWWPSGNDIDNNGNWVPAGFTSAYMQQHFHYINPPPKYQGF